MVLVPLVILSLAAGQVSSESSTSESGEVPAPAPVEEAVPAPASADTAAAPVASTKRFGSIQGGETLGLGGTVLALSGGLFNASAAYAQGISDGTDYGLQLELDWMTTEIVAGGLFRQVVWRSGDTFASVRVRAGFYGDLGSSWLASANRSDGGLQFQPGMAVSARVMDGLLSAAADMPLDLTFSRSGGAALGMRWSGAYERRLRPDLTVGGRVGVGVLWSTAGAPFAHDSPRAMYDFSVLLTYQLF